MKRMQRAYVMRTALGRPIVCAYQQLTHGALYEQRLATATVYLH